MIDDRKKQTALDLLPVVIDLDAPNSQLTTNSETDEPFLIIEDWRDLGIIQRELNKYISPNAFWQNNDDYKRLYGKDAYQEMRFGVEKYTGKRTRVWEGKPLYLVPDGLFNLDEVVEWGFSDEHITCDNCYRSISTTPGYYGDKPRYAEVNNEVLCGDCIVNNYEDEYLETIINHPTKAVNTAIISEERLNELGWTQKDEKYYAGLHEGHQDNPKLIYQKIRNETMCKTDVIFTYDTSQFDIDFWMWTKPSD